MISVLVGRTAVVFLVEASRRAALVIGVAAVDTAKLRNQSQSYSKQRAGRFFRWL
jgi:hypothetical protein